MLDPGRELHVFEEVARTVVRYVGQFKPDDREPHYPTDAPDQNQELRTAIVFRLWPVDVAIQPVQPVPVTNETVSTEIPLEAHNVNAFAAYPAAGPTSVERREAALVQRYRAWLHAQGKATVRNEIRLAGQPRSLLTDLFNQHAHELIEAKAPPPATTSALPYAKFSTTPATSPTIP